MWGKILKRILWAIVIVFALQTFFLFSNEQAFLKRAHGMYYSYNPVYHSEEYGELTFKSSSEGGYYIWQEYEKEYHTETGGYITIKYAMVLGIYVDLTDEEKNRETANLL